MKYSVYFDLTLREYPDIPLWDTLGRVWRIVHVAGANTQQIFAVAFPKQMTTGFSLGAVIRVFAMSLDAADALYDSIENTPGIEDLLSGSRVRKVNIENVTGYEAYVMKRISGKVDAKFAADPEKVEMHMQRLLRQKAQQQHLPFVRMRSSTGALFKLVFDRILVDSDSTGAPNGYGLSRKDLIAALPIFK